MGDDMHLVIGQIDQRLRTIETRQAELDRKVDRINARLNGWAGALATLGALAGAAVTAVIAYASRKWWG